MSIAQVGSSFPIGVGVSIEAGTGSPEGIVPGIVGALWIQLDGTLGKTLWKKYSGVGATGWTLIDDYVFNVMDFGAKGDGITDDYAAIQAAITAAATSRNNNPISGIRGGIVAFDAGTYLTSAPLILPLAVNDQSLILRGAGKRATTIVPIGNSSNFTNGVIGFGPGTRDASGSTNFITQYCGIEDLGVSGSALTGNSNAVGIRMTETQRCWMTNVLIQSFITGSSIGLLMEGSVTTGLGAAAAPHCWRSNLTGVDVATSIRPLVCNNVDESDFMNCNFGPPPGLATPGLIAIELIQYHNLRFYGLLLSGSNDANRPNYIGLKCDAPVNGDCIGLSIYGIVAEGFDYALYFGGGNHQDVWVYHLGAAETSIGTPGNRKIFYNGADDGGNERRNNVHIFMGGSALATGIPDYHSGRLPTPEPLTLIMNGGGAFTPSVAAGNTFATSTNTGGSTITNFLNGTPGQLLVVRLDANVSIVHNTSLIRCPGAANIAGAAHKVVSLVHLGGLWYVTGVQTDA
jgi:pectate lyase-like protein